VAPSSLQAIVTMESYRHDEAWAGGTFVPDLAASAAAESDDSKVGLILIIVAVILIGLIAGVLITARGKQEKHVYTVKHITRPVFLASMPSSLLPTLHTPDMVRPVFEFWQLRRYSLFSPPPPLPPPCTLPIPPPQISRFTMRGYALCNLFSVVAGSLKRTQKKLDKCIFGAVLGLSRLLAF